MRAPLRLPLLLPALLWAGLTAVSPAQAATYSFACLSNNNAGNCGDGAARLVMEVTDAGYATLSGQQVQQVDFTFRNSSLLGSAITEIYFDDGSLLGIDSLIEPGPGVNFQTKTVKPEDLPGSNHASPPFDATSGFSADVNQNTADGVQNLAYGGVQEYLTIRFNLQAQKTFADTLRSLNGEITDTTADVTYPALRVGLHVRAFANGGSESFMNLVPAAVMPTPESDSYALILAGMGLVGLLARRRR